MKNIIIIFLIFCVGILSLMIIGKSIEYRNLATDSGFDASYDRGGSSSGYSSDSSSSSSRHDDYSRSSGSSGGTGSVTLRDVLCAMEMFFYLIVSFFIAFVRKKVKKDEDEFIFIYLYYVLFSCTFTFMFYVISLFFNDFLLIYLSIVFFILYLVIGFNKRKLILYALVVTYIIIGASSLPFFVKSIISYIKNSPNIFIDPATILILIFVIMFMLAFIIDENRVEKRKWTKILKSNGLVYKKIINDGFEIYKKIQIAWMDDNIDSVSDILSDEILNMYESQLSTLRVKKEQNIMSDISFRNGKINEVLINDDNIKIIVRLNVTCKDYIINKETKEVLRGDASKIRWYTYLLTFIVNKNNLKNCPNCGAVLKEGGGVKCPSCGSKLILNNGKMMMTDKKMINQN